MSIKRHPYRTIAVSLAMALACTSAWALTDTFHLDRVYPVNPRGTLTLITSDADVAIVGEERTDVHVVVDYVSEIKCRGRVRKSGKFGVEISLSGGGLILEDRHPALSVSGNVSVITHKYHIRIRAPRTMDLHIRCEDDDYVVRGMRGTVDLRMEGGNASFTDMHGDRFAFKVGDGDCRMKGGRGRVQASVGDGNLILEKGEFTSLEGAVGDGTIMVETTLADGGRYDLRAGDGTLRFAVAAGGGTFWTSVEDGEVRAGPRFRLLEQTDETRRYVLPGGSAGIRLKAVDGTIILERR